MDIAKGKIANAITSAAINHIVATTDDLYDTDMNEYQNVINKSIKDILEGVAKEKNATANKEEILRKIVNTANSLKGPNAEATLSNIITAIDEISFDKSDLAKTGTDDTVTLTVLSQIITKGVRDILQGIINSQTQLGNVVAKEEKATENKNEIISSIKGENQNATNTVILEVFNHIDFSALAKTGENDNVTLTLLYNVILQSVIDILTGVSETERRISDAMAKETTATSNREIIISSIENAVNTLTGGESGTTLTEISYLLNTYTQELKDKIDTSESNVLSGVTQTEQHVINEISDSKEEIIRKIDSDTDSLRGENNNVTLSSLNDDIQSLDDNVAKESQATENKNEIISHFDVSMEEIKSMMNKIIMRDYTQDED